MIRQSRNNVAGMEVEKRQRWLKGDLALGRTSYNALRFVILCGAVYCGLKVWAVTQFVLLPLAIALLASALLMPVVDKLQTLRVPRWLAAVTTVLAALIFIVGILAWVIPDIANESTAITDQIKSGLDEVPSVLHSFGLKNTDIQRFTTDITEELQNSAGKIGGELSKGALTFAKALASAATTIFLAIMMLIYLLIDGRGFWNGALRFFPEHRRKVWNFRGLHAARALTLFVRSQVLVAAIDGIGIGVGLAIIGVPLAFPIGVLTFVLAFLPYIGAILAGLLAALVALSTKGPEAMLAAIVLTIIVQQVEGNILYPLLVGRSLKLHPLTVLLGVGVGSAVAGIAGAFLATPLIASVAAAAGWLSDGLLVDEEGATDVTPPPDEILEPVT